MSAKGTYVMPITGVQLTVCESYATVKQAVERGKRRQGNVMIELHHPTWVTVTDSHVADTDKPGKAIAINADLVWSIQPRMQDDP